MMNLMRLLVFLERLKHVSSYQETTALWVLIILTINFSAVDRFEYLTLLYETSSDTNVMGEGVGE